VVEPIQSRHRWRRFNATGSYFLREVFTGLTTNRPSNLWDITEYMLDETHRYKQIGKSMRDIGGPMKHFRAEWDFGLNTSLIQSGKTSGPYAKVIARYKPSLGWGFSDQDGRSTAAWYLWRAISSPSATDSSVGLAVGQYGTPLWRSNTLTALGATAISRCQPTNPAVDTATSVAELISEGGLTKMIPGRDRTISGEYLNYSLGIAPTVGFANDLRKAMLKSEEIISQYERDAGRRVRRKYDFPWETEVTSLSTTGLVAPDLERPYTQSEVVVDGSIKIHRTITRKTRFSGAFTYAAPEAGWRRTLAEVDRVYGVRPGSETAWNLIPLSFVADYWGNTGDVLGNLDAYAQDGLVMPYGYIVSEDEIKHEISGTVLGTFDGRTTAYPISGSFIVTLKERQPANPFGFGVSWGSLSPRRLSILAALGITRVR
jgi:hypothetical protein